MTISTNCAYNNQTHCNIKNLYFNKHKHKHMVNHICWNPSFFPLPNADIHEISNFYQKRHLFIKNYSFFIKNLIDPPYKKLQPQISPFIKNSIFGNNRDPCGGTPPNGKFPWLGLFNPFLTNSSSGLIFGKVRAKSWQKSGRKSRFLWLLPFVIVTFCDLVNIQSVVWQTAQQSSE